jgi:pimeloyl-ACP methyl ester carboxylesterase
MVPTHLSYSDQGNGPIVVLLHGFPFSKAIWHGVADSLAHHYRVICIDLPGFGDNPGLTAPITIADTAERIHQQLNLLDVQLYTLIGHSMGGYVAMAFAEKFPEKLSGLGLVHSTAFSDSLEKKQGRNRSIDFIERYGVTEFVSEFVKPLFYEARREQLAEAMREASTLGRKVPKATAVECIKAMRDRKDRTKVLDKLRVPVLFIQGRNDTAIPLSVNSPQFWMPADATIHILPHTAHMSMYEQQPTLTMYIGQFLQYVTTPRD